MGHLFSTVPLMSSALPSSTKLSGLQAKCGLELLIINLTLCEV